MNIQREQMPKHAIESYQHDMIQIAGIQYQKNALVFTESIISPWTHEYAWDMWEQVLPTEIEVLIVGHSTPVSIPIGFRENLANRRIGMEAMNLGAACRTFNLLLAEGRAVGGLFLFNNK
ncbi:MAG: hypothetical protein EBQ95_06005 [Gammaproteobacteria bacterium]|nr:hypothetical protein [Gammaproteobacteria bacterium]